MTSPHGTVNRQSLAVRHRPGGKVSFVGQRLSGARKGFLCVRMRTVAGFPHLETLKAGQDLP